MARSVLRVVAGCLIKDGRALFAQRPAHKADGGLWELPGGKVEPGESDAQALARELAEELHIEVEVGPELGQVLVPGEGDRDLLLVAYLVTLRSGRPIAVEAQALAWVDGAGLAKLSCPAADQPLLPGLAVRLKTHLSR